MNAHTLTRYAAPAATAAAVLGIPADLYHFTMSSRAEAAGEFLFKVHGMLLVAAFCLALVALWGMATSVGDRLGRLGWAGFSLAYVGTILAIADIAREAFWMPLAPELMDNPTGYTLAMIVGSFAAFSSGWLLFGAALARRGIVSMKAALPLCTGAFIAFVPIPAAYVVLLIGIAVTARSLAGTAPRHSRALVSPADVSATA